MENNFDSEDLAVFHRSLQLLHSPKIDSQRKLYHLLQQSIKKHHPSSKSGKRTSALPCTEYSGTSTLSPEKNLSEVKMAYESQTPADQYDQEMNKEHPQSPQKATNVQIQKNKITSTNFMSESTQNNEQSDNSTFSPVLFTASTNIPLFKNNSQPCFKNTVHNVSQNTNHTPPHSSTNKEANVFKQPLKHAAKCLARHTYCPPVNLKKIRAVLARGDPFPTHLTKVCMNNITPDLQREKL